MSRHTHDTTPPAWSALFAAVGGRAALAHALEVAESTVYRWSREIVPVPKTARLAIDTLCTRHGLAPIFESAVETPSTGVRPIIGEE